MSKIALMVRYRVRPERREEVVALVSAHARHCIETEAGCVQFDIMLPQGVADEVRLYEVYADPQAYEVHRTSAQLARYREQSAPLLLEREIVVCEIC